MMNNKEKVIQQFGKNAEKYVTSKVHAKGKDLSMLTEIAKANKGEHLLDIATGGGHVANAMAPLYENVVALDLTKEMLEEARGFIVNNGHTNVSFIQGDAESLSFQNGTFDTISCRIAPHHFPHVNRFVNEVHRTLKKKGLFLLVDNVAPELDEYDQFYNYIEKKRDSSHHRAYKKTEWVSLLEHEGFRIESFTIFKKEFIFEVWCNMMNLPGKEKAELNDYIISCSANVRKYFSVNVTDNKVESFQGEAMLLVARKE